VTDVAPRRRAAAAVAAIADAEAELRALTRDLDPRLVLAPDVECARRRLEQVVGDRVREAAALIPQFEAQLAAAEPEHDQRIGAAKAAQVRTYEAWRAAAEAEQHEQDLGNVVVAGLTTAIAALRAALAARLHEDEARIDRRREGVG
jgi:hypothetical protein